MVIDGASTFGLLEPELDEARELLRLGMRGVDGDAARRGAVLIVLAARCGSSWRPGRPASRFPCRGRPSRESRRSRGRRAACRPARVRRSRSQSRRIDDLARLPSDSSLMRTPERIELVDVKHAHRDTARARRPQRAIGAELDRLHGIEVDLVDDRRRRRRRDVGLGGQRFGARPQRLEGERFWLAEARWRRLGATRGTRSRDHHEQGPRAPRREDLSSADNGHAQHPGLTLLAKRHDMANGAARLSTGGLMVRLAAGERAVTR